MGARTSSVQLASALSSVPVGRHFVRDLLIGWDLAAAVDDASLAVTELIANAVKHARSTVIVKVVVDSDILVSVHDRSPQIVKGVIPAAPLAESGRGLRIVAAVSSEWGVTPERTGKCHWFRLPLPDSAGADADVITLRATTMHATTERALAEVDETGLRSRATAS